MTKAQDIAKTAYEQALAAAESEAARRKAKEEEHEAQKAAEHQVKFEAALPILNEWFPGVEWSHFGGGDYGYDTIVHDVAEEWPWSFMLRIERRRDGSVEIDVGGYRQDTSMPGYSYFSGVEVKSAADVGRYLEGKQNGT